MMNEHEPIKDGISGDAFSDFPEWEKLRDIIDQLMDVVFNYRQSGHPGGSRSKLPMFPATLLGEAMKWDIRDLTRRFSDRFVLGAGHTAPLIYCTMAVFNEAMRFRFAKSGDSRFRIRDEAERVLYAERLLGFRRRGGLSGHPEMQGRSMFVKANTGALAHARHIEEGIRRFVRDRPSHLGKRRAAVDEAITPGP